MSWLSYKRLDPDQKILPGRYLSVFSIRPWELCEPRSQTQGLQSVGWGWRTPGWRCPLQQCRWPGSRWGSPHSAGSPCHMASLWGSGKLRRGWQHYSVIMIKYSRSISDLFPLQHARLALVYHKPYTLKTEESLLASMAPWRTFNIHGIFPLHKTFFTVEKASSDYF